MAHRVKLTILSSVRFLEEVHSYLSEKLRTKKRYTYIVSNGWV